MFERYLTKKFTSLRSCQLFVVLSNYLLRHTLHGCGSLRPFKLFVVRSNYLQKNTATAARPPLVQIICSAIKLFAKAHTATAARPPPIQIVCSALKLFANYLQMALTKKGTGQELARWNAPPLGEAMPNRWMPAQQTLIGQPKLALLP